MRLASRFRVFLTSRKDGRVSFASAGPLAPASIVRNLVRAGRLVTAERLSLFRLCLALSRCCCFECLPPRLPPRRESIGSAHGPALDPPRELRRRCLPPLALFPLFISRLPRSRGSLPFRFDDLAAPHPAPFPPPPPALDHVALVASPLAARACFSFHSLVATSLPRRAHPARTDSFFAPLSAPHCPLSRNAKRRGRL